MTFSKSGRERKHSQTRTGWHWWYEPPHVTESYANAPDVLDGYDLIVLNEPKNGTLDREALRKNEVPYYLGALEQTRTPWMTVLHDTRYNDNIAPFVHRCLEAGNFTGIAVQHQYQSFEMNTEWLAGIRFIQPWPWLPYARASIPPEPVQRGAIFGLLGRVAPTKGQITLAYVADQLPPGWEVWLCGNEPGGRGACNTFLCWEMLTERMGWVGFRQGNGQKPPTPNNNYGDKLKCWPWMVQKGQNTVRFTGPYENGVQSARQFAVSVNLTVPSFSRTLEYTTLEAIDAGCVIVAPQHCLDVTPGAYDFITLKKWGDIAIGIGQNAKPRTAKFVGEPEQELVQSLHMAAAKALAGDQSIAFNQYMLETQHAPHLLASQMLALVGSGQHAVA